MSRKLARDKVKVATRDVAIIVKSDPVLDKLNDATEDVASVLESTPSRHIVSPPPKPKSSRLFPHSTPKKCHGKSRLEIDAIEIENAQPLLSNENVNVKDDEVKDDGRKSIKKSKMIIQSGVRKVYKILQKKTGALGGNGYVGAIYGELTMHSMQKIIDILVEKCEMTSKSRFIDVGSGLGKPNFHAAQYPGVRISVGIELEDIRYQLAMHNLDTFLETLIASNGTGELKGGVNFMCGDMDAAESTDPFTHIYMYDLGFPPDLQRSIARKFNSSQHARYLVSYRPPHRVTGEEYGYEVDFVSQIPTSMHGSGESHTAYFYKRRSSSIPPSVRITSDTIAAAGLCTLTLAGRPNADNEADELVFCADAFAAVVTAAAGPVTALKAQSKAVVTSHLDGGRPVRTRSAITRLNV